MLSLMLKDLRRGKKMLIISLGLGLIYINNLASVNDDNLMVGSFIFMLVFSVIITNEHYEDRYRGYSLLKTLPLKPYKIVVSKFSLAFLMILLGVIYVFTVLTFTIGLPSIGEISIISILNTGAMALMSMGIFYALMFKIGAPKAISYSRIVFFLIFFSPSIADKLLRLSGITGGLVSVLGELTLYHSFVGLSISLIIYFLLMLRSIAIFRNMDLS